jgi:hypothetical protein
VVHGWPTNAPVGRPSGVVPVVVVAVFVVLPAEAGPVGVHGSTVFVDPTEPVD